MRRPYIYLRMVDIWIGQMLCTFLTELIHGRMSLGWSGIRLLDSMLICVACGNGSFKYKIELSTTRRHGVVNGQNALAIYGLFYYNLLCMTNSICTIS